ILGLVNSLIAKRNTVRAGDLAREAGVSRQAAHRHLAALVKEGMLIREGAGRGAMYKPSGAPLSAFRYPREGLAEDQVWNDIASKSPVLKGMAENIDRILYYSLTQLVNNAIDHSKATWVEVIFPPSPRITFEVLD